jgi:hypothetical protein
MIACMSSWSFLAAVGQAGAFIAPVNRKSTFPKTVCARRMQMLPATDFTSSDGFQFSSILMAVDFFDGSEVIDPVVVSSLFWTSLKANILSLFIAQVLAVVVFAIISSVAAKQIGSLTDYLSKKFLGDSGGPKKLKVPPTMSYISQPDFLKLTFCIAIDVIGTSSIFVPFVGELTDILWAPIAAYALRSLYGSNVLFALEFIEQILPFTDILPLATLCWVVDTFLADSDLAKLLQVGRYGLVDGSDPSAIDVKAKSETEPGLGVAGRSDCDDGK